MVDNTTNGGGNTGRGVEENPRIRAPPHSNGVVGEPSSSLSSCGQGQGGGGGGGWDREDAAYQRGTSEGSSALAEGQQRQRLRRSDSDRAILGRVDYKAVKRDLR